MFEDCCRHPYKIHRACNYLVTYVLLLFVHIENIYNICFKMLKLKASQYEG